MVSGNVDNRPTPIRSWRAVLGSARGWTFRAVLAVALVIVFRVAATAEVSLQLPDPLVPNVEVDGAVVVTNAPGQVRNIVLPEVPGLSWSVNGSTSSQVSIINGARSESVRYGIVLHADREGTLTLPPVQVHLRNGDVLASAERQLRVKAGQEMTGDLVAEATFSPSTIITGESTTLTYRLMAKGGEFPGLGISPPADAIILVDQQQTRSNTVDREGNEWAVLTFTWQLTFSSPGPRTVQGQQELRIQLGDGLFDRRVKRVRASVAPATVTVQPLPLDGRPADFAGLIGPVTIAARLDRPRISAGEGVGMTVTVSGRQVDLLKTPELVLPSGLTAYPKDPRTTGNARVFSWDLVPSMPGELTLPTVSIPYFDIASRSYRRAVSDPLQLIVTPGRTRELAVAGQATTAPATQPVTTPTSPSVPAPRRGQATPLPAPWLAPLVGVAGLLIALGIGLIASRPRRAGPHRGRALRQAALDRDPLAVTAAVAALRSAPFTDQQREALEALQRAVDRHRFGGEPFPDLAHWIRDVEGVP